MRALGPTAYFDPSGHISEPGRSDNHPFYRSVGGVLGYGLVATGL